VREHGARGEQRERATTNSDTSARPGKRAARPGLRIGLLLRQFERYSGALASLSRACHSVGSEVGMADEMGESEGKGPAVLSMWCVAFLDLLGYRSLLQQMDVFPMPETEPEHEQFQKAFARAVHFRTRLDGYFRTLLQSSARVPDNQLEAFPEHQRRQADAMTRMKVLQTTGADHVAIGCSLADDEGHFPIIGVYTVLEACASSMLVQLMIGGDDPMDTLPLRGGIDVAMGGVDPRSGYLYSAAMANAYDLEQKAIYPRTLVSWRLREYLLDISMNVADDVASKYARAIAIKATDLITTDTDGMPMLDFFGEACAQSVENPPEMAAAAWRYVTSSAERFRSAGSTRVAEKYEWLVNYMQPRLKFWGIEAQSRA
jgi:hypothetical protein